MASMSQMLHVTHDVTTRPHTDLKKNYRNFFVRTYLNKESVYSLVSLCSKWAFIYHDKDDAEPHFHVLMHFDNGRTVKSISKYLQCLAERQAKDFSMSIQKSHCEVCDEPKTAYKYLTHTDASSIAKGKTIYSDTEVYSEGVEFFKDGDTKDFAVTDMLDAINNGMPFREMASKFGKSFVTQYGKYRDYAIAMAFEEKKCIHDSVSTLLQGYLEGKNTLYDVLSQCVIEMAYQQVFKAETRELEQFKRNTENRKNLQGLLEMYDNRCSEFAKVKFDGECVQDLLKCEVV